MNMFNLKKIITKPTRLGALLNPILCSDECDITFSDVIQVDRTFSDHDATSVSLRVPFNLQTSYKRDVWLYKHGNFVGFNLEIENFDWDSFLLHHDNVDEMAIKFSDKYLEMAKSFIPFKTVTIRPNDKPWFNSAIRKEIRIRDRLHKQVKRSPSSCILQKYRTQRNKVNNMIYYTKEQFFINANDLLDKDKNVNPKSYCGLVKKLQGYCKVQNIPPLVKDESNEIVVNDTDKANLLNKFFCSISNIADSNLSPPNFENRTDNRLDILSVTTEEVKDILETLQLGKAVGHDHISHNMLKYTSSTVCKPLQIFF